EPLPPATATRHVSLPPRSKLPGFTRPPIRMRAPGTTCFSARSVGELKNTMESRIALSTSATAMARTPRLAPIKINRRCFRVISSRSTFEPQAPDHVVDPPELVGIVCKRPFCIRGGGMRFVTLAEDHISSQQALPAFNVVAVLLQSVGQSRHHAADHFAAVFFAHVVCRGDVFDPRSRRIDDRGNDAHAR